jgi:hypothetical protein
MNKLKLNFLIVPAWPREKRLTCGIPVGEIIGGMIELGFHGFKKHCGVIA